MRSFNDTTGKPWQAALMDASYGNVMLIFSRVGASDTRQTLLNVENLAAAQQFLAAVEEAELCELLGAAEPWS